MKIRITEKQLNAIKTRLTEDVNIVNKFEQLCKEKAQEVNKIYLKVIGFSVDEIINSEINISNMIDYLWNLENVIIYNKEKEAYAFIESLPEDEASDLDLRIYEAKSFVGKKIDAITLILESLKKIQTGIEDKEIDFKKLFSEVKPIDITPKEI